jgi:hypothetical protein
MSHSTGLPASGHSRPSLKLTRSISVAPTPANPRCQAQYYWPLTDLYAAATKLLRACPSGPAECGTLAALSAEDAIQLRRYCCYG